MEHLLSHPFWPVQTNAGTAFGLSQSWSAYPALRGWGCGPAAALMVLGYLHLYHPDSRSSPMKHLTAAPDRKECVDLLDSVGRRQFPILPKYGVNGITLAWQMNRYFRRNRIPYRASWCSSREKALSCMAKMLDDDIPVIFSVGPDFPLLWQKHPLDLYGAPGDTRPCSTARAHYMVAVGMKNGWLELSSWGRKYYLPLAAWREHHKYHSGHLVDGIIALRRTHERKGRDI